MYIRDNFFYVKHCLCTVHGSFSASIFSHGMNIERKFTLYCLFKDMHVESYLKKIPVPYLQIRTLATDVF